VGDGKVEDTRFIAALRRALGEADLALGTQGKTLCDCSQLELWWSGTTGEPLDPEDIHITAVDLQEWRGVLVRRGITPGTIQRKFMSLRACLKLLNPELAVRLRWPRLPQAQVNAPSGFTANQRNAILRAAEQLSPRDEAIVKVLMYTGARASTVAAAKLSRVHISERSGWIEYDVSKNQRTYRVPLCSEARHALGRWLAARPPAPHGFLFCSERRLPFPPISRAVVWQAWKSLAAFLPKGFPLGGPHAARHDLARRLLSGDEGRTTPTPAADVAAILGHADPRICVAIYSRPSPESLERAVGRLAGDEGE
jgi:integrase/recombinase XerC